MANPPTQFGQQQWAFITKTRAAIKNDPRGFFAENNWRNITPTGCKNDSNLFCRNKKTTVDAFYVRPICCWVPHLLLISNHVPSCPRCKLKDDIDLVKSRWINFRKSCLGFQLTDIWTQCSIIARSVTGHIFRISQEVSATGCQRCYWLL